MRHPDRPFSNRILPVLGLGISLGLGMAQVTLAAADETYAGPAAPVSTAELAPAATNAPPPDGQQVYNKVCIACHAPPGVGGAPALGNAEAWAPRIAQGMDTLVAHALNGFSGKTGVMPRKGERLDLSDAEVAAAVHFMVEQATQ